MRLSDLYSQIADSIRVHHASGHFDHQTARNRLIAQTGVDVWRADDILALNVPASMFDEYKTWPPSGRAGRPAQCTECGR